MKSLSFRRKISIFIIFAIMSTFLYSCTKGSDKPQETKPTTKSEDKVSVKNLPRKETLYFNGFQWGPVASANPIHPDPLAFISNNRFLPQLVIYETLFRYNILDGKLYPLLGTEYKWNNRTLTVKLNKDAKWNDGKPFTADDVVYTLEFGKKYDVNFSSIWSYIDGVTKVDDQTIELKASEKPFNPKEVESIISCVYMLPKHVWEGLEKENGESGEKLTQLFNENPVATGPYKLYSYDDTMVVMERDDNYWGQAKSMYGKLPAPKYLAHNIFKDNASGDAAFKAGEVDVSRQFVSQIWNMWEKEKLPVETYLSKAPYYIPGAIPSLVFNVTKPGLDDVAVRKAIALSIDYKKIGEVAVSGYTDPVVPSLMLPTKQEQDLIDKDALKPLQWNNAEIDDANKVLDEAGWKKGSDGVREKNGVKLSYKLLAPSGWSDWNATLEIVAQDAKKIGIDLQTNFPEYGVYSNDRGTGNFDIVMNSYAGVGIASPLKRASEMMGSEYYAKIGETAQKNYGRYQNKEADKIMESISSESDPGKLKEYWTQLNKIYLEELPTCPLMYRPYDWHQVNTSVWTGFPKEGDGTNVPPGLCVDGYGIESLYKIKAK